MQKWRQLSGKNEILYKMFKIFPAMHNSSKGIVATHAKRQTTTEIGCNDL